LDETPSWWVYLQRMKKAATYDQRGVSADKSEVHQAIQGLDKGLFANAFCKVLPDLVGGDEGYCTIMHADTAGTKTSLAYLYWRETGDLSVWEGIAQDAIAMNLDDIACMGCTSPVIISSTIGRNKHKIPQEVLTALIQGNQKVIDALNNLGCEITLAGGETADVGDGQATFENEYNGGMGSNGLTSARHDILHKSYREKYPESFDPNTPIDLIYRGTRELTEKVEIPGYESTTIGKLILSPTRLYYPVVCEMVKAHRQNIYGIIHCSGGAQTKVGKFIENVHLVKDNLFDVPPLFQMIASESNTPDREMYQVFNMGHRMELYVDEDVAEGLMTISKSYNIEAKIIGRVESSEKPKISIRTPNSVIDYTDF